jgi:hypothetical protein
MIKYKYIRNTRLKVATENGEFDFSKFDVSFQVIHASISSPKIMKCRIKNLSHGGRGTTNTIGVIQSAKNKRATLDFWYNGGSPATLFDGDIRMIYAGRESPTDTYLEIEAEVFAQEWAMATLCKTIPAGWTHEDACKAVINNMQGMKLGQIPQVQGSGSRAKTFYGNQRDHIRALSKNLSGHVVVNDDGVVDILSAQNPKKLGSVIKITPFNGMIGTPVQVPEGIQVTALIDPNFKVGAVIDVYSLNASDSRTAVEQEEVELNFTGINEGNQYVDSQGNLRVKGLASNGLYSILFVDHVGDSRGTSWYTTIIGQAVNPDERGMLTNKAISAGLPQ